MADQGILRAEQRVREMNRMTQHYTEQGNRYMQNITAPPPRFEPMIHPGQDRPAPPEPIPEPHPEQRPEPKHRGQSQKKDPGSILPGIEGDKLLLIALIYLLIKENADIKLILAIAYLLL